LRWREGVTSALYLWSASAHPSPSRTLAGRGQTRRGWLLFLLRQREACGDTRGPESSPRKGGANHQREAALAIADKVIK
jgi:hypothetical protein